jgi:hypothetical protein
VTVDHGIRPGRSSYATTGKDAARLEADLHRQRQQVAGRLAGLVGDVQQQRRTMNSRMLEEVCAAATRLADLDRALWAARVPQDAR